MRQLQQLISIPTIAQSSRHRGALEQAAHALCTLLSGIGLTRCQILRAGPSAPPNVWGEWRRAPGQPVLLIYGHFDVQPPGPARAWAIPPFAGAVAGGRIHGRGASDNKGPLIAHLAGIESHLATSGRLPVNVRVWLDGEEEAGSPHLHRLLERHGERLRCDGLVVSDSTRMTRDGRPALVTGLRGTADVRITVDGPPRALHSGVFGGEVLDPALVLATLLASIWRDGRICVPGFYRRVRPPGGRERARLALGRPTACQFARLLGVTENALQGEADWAPGERSALRPSVTITELASSGGGPAAIATRAAARLNLRLVPDQRAAEITALLAGHLRRQAPPGVVPRIKLLASTDPVVIPVGHPLVMAAARALAAAWGTWPAITRSGGTMPAVAALHHRFGMPVAMWGISSPSDAIHAPGESFGLTDLHRGTEAVIRLLSEASL
jgi:acetylornithine deacetylase/succinyl-diaminopimelate desuccinylase-like protein